MIIDKVCDIIDLDYYRETKKIGYWEFCDSSLTESGIEQIETQLEEKAPKTFEDIIKENKRAENNLKKKRAKDNENVMKSYRLK